MTIDDNIEKISKEDAPVVVGLTFDLKLNELVKFCRPVLQHIKLLGKKYKKIEEIRKKYNESIQDLLRLVSEYFLLVLAKCGEGKFGEVHSFYKEYIGKFSEYFDVPEEAINWRDKYSEYIQERREKDRVKKENN